jgi:DNA-binding PadR family transcriptional regulator
MEIDKGLIGGSTILLLLSLLEESDMYGYEIIKKLEVKSDNTFRFKEGTLYPVLHKLENKGYIKSYMSISSAGKERKYYRITNSGIKQLAEEKENWERFSLSVNKVIGGGIHAFA